MKFFNIFGKKQNSEKMVTDDSKYINSEVGVIRSQFIQPRFSRFVACNAYTGYMAAALDANSQAVASGTLRLYSKTSKNGQKCFFPTKKHPSLYQQRYIKGHLIDKPASYINIKLMDSESDFEIVRSHPLNDLFMAVNPSQNFYQFCLDIALQLEITGDAFIHVVSFSDGTPAQLYVLQSKFVDIIPAKSGSGMLVEKYEYKRAEGTSFYFSPDELIHVKYPDPSNFWYGKGKIEKAWEAFLKNKYSNEMQIALYANHSVGDFIITNKSGNTISKSRLKHIMQSMYRGAKNRGKSMFLDADVDVKTLAFKPKDLSDITFNIQEIASITGCPINKLIGNDNIKANSEEQNVAWLRGTITPIQNLIASTLSENLLYRYDISDGDAFLAFDSVIPEDLEQKRKLHETYKTIGVMTTNEIRSDLGLDPIENGDELESPTPPTPTSDDSNDDKTLDSELKQKLDIIIQDLNKQVKVAPIASTPPFVININGEIEEEEIEEEIEDNSVVQLVAQQNRTSEILAKKDNKLREIEEEENILEKKRGNKEKKLNSIKEDNEYSENILDKIVKRIK